MKFVYTYTYIAYICLYIYIHLMHCLKNKKNSWSISYNMSIISKHLANVNGLPWCQRHSPRFHRSLLRMPQTNDETTGQWFFMGKSWEYRSQLRLSHRNWVGSRECSYPPFIWRFPSIGDLKVGDFYWVSPRILGSISGNHRWKNHRFWVLTHPPFFGSPI